MGRLLRKRKTVNKKKQGDDPPLMVKDADNKDPRPPASTPADTYKQQNQPRKKPSVSFNKDGYIEKTLQYLREVKAELKKVTWPSRQQTAGSTVVVIVIVMIISVFLGIADMSLSGLIRLVFQ
ncbi:Protein translocase subunit [Desulfonema limicola]|uniref:Protein translocase subunit SecE n=1 Tax=Desulfonema limicola TaxID=45656 RepID=A0A975B4V7_9BACT|nr:preprotein translocase subunit SecE [Desulfonema limicola]QTA78830.1 Protein translocase subunit [Desulfonema limicola]